MWIKAARVLALSLVLALGACAQQERGGRGEARGGPSVETETVIVHTANGPVHFTVEIADDDAERARGLMFRESMAADHGMLFHFQQPEMASFWMRNTRISLDIIFIGPDGRILNIADHTVPYSEAGVPAAGLTRGVLEINAGRAEELGIRAGDRVEHRIFQQ
jgi:hypothetical protein